MADNLKDILAIARRQLPDVPDATWSKIEQAIRNDFGCQRPYIAAHKKRSHLEALAEADQKMAADQLAAKLGISPRRVRQLKKLK